MSFFFKYVSYSNLVPNCIVPSPLFLKFGNFLDASQTETLGDDMMNAASDEQLVHRAGT